MVLRIGQPVELPAVFESQGDSLLARELHDLLDTRVLAAFGDHDAVDGALCFERFLHGVNAGQAIHGTDSLQVAGRSMKAAVRLRP